MRLYRLLRLPYTKLLFTLLIIFNFNTAFGDETVGHQIFSDLLKKYVNNGIVNYSGFKAEESKLDRYLTVLENVKPDTLSRNEQFAFYINAYNAWTIKLILSGYPGIKSIKDLGGFFKSPWKKEIARIGGNTVTLDHIEHDILRPEFKDARVHFAVNCASKGCPPLQPYAFSGKKLDHQLNEVARAFINDHKRNRLEGRKLYVSKIFKWFKEDFNEDIVGFFLKYAEGELKNRLSKNKDDIKVKYLDYDWSLNGV